MLPHHNIYSEKFSRRYQTHTPEALQSCGEFGWILTAHTVIGTAGLALTLEYTEQPILNEKGFHTV
jgi:hypothetical protein